MELKRFDECIAAVEQEARDQRRSSRRGREIVREIPQRQVNCAVGIMRMPDVDLDGRAEGIVRMEVVKPLSHKVRSDELCGGLTRIGQILGVCARRTIRLMMYTYFSSA